MDIKKYDKELEEEQSGCEDDALLNVEVADDEYNALPDTGIATGEEVIAALEAAYKQIPHFHQRLLFYTLKWVRIYFHSSMIRELTVEDVVQTVLTKILTVQRKWNKNYFPEIADFVRFAILSFIRNEQKRVEVVEFEDVYDESEESRKKNFEDVVKQIFSEDIADNFLRETFEECYLKCEDRLKDDVYASFVFEERVKGEKSNIKIAENLKIEIEEVENAIKRIKRKLWDIFFGKK